MIKPGLVSLDSMFLVPGEEAEFETTKDVPARRGPRRLVSLRHARIRSRRMHVYTPPGYEGGTEKYPVLYLLHGGGDEDSGWSTIGRAGLHPRQPDRGEEGRADDRGDAQRQPADARRTCPRSTPGTPPSPEVRAAMEAVQNRFTDELLKEVVPFVEKTYRVKTGPENRAIAGLSMGGGQTLRVLTTHPDQFAYVGIWSAGLFGGNAEDWEKRNESVPRRRPTRSTGRSSGSRSASATRTSPWRRARRRWPGCSRSTGSSTRSTSAAAAIPGSTGATT